MPTFHAAPLREFAAALLARGGFRSDEARLMAESLVDANLCGYDSHGLMRVPQYVQMLADGEVASGVELEVLRETAGSLAADAHWGVGQVQAGRLLERLVPKAREHGTAAGTLLRCGHIGRLGEYCERAAGLGLVSLLMVNSHGAVVRVAPPGGKAPRLSTNPLAIGAPRGSEPLVLDFSTSVVAEGKVRVKKIAGEACPEGWLLDSEGRPTTDPNALYGSPPGSILPMGGAQAYKGFGLGLMVEILTGALSGGQCAREQPTGVKGNCVLLLLLDPACFGGAAPFANEVAQLARYVQSCPPVQAGTEVLLPGDPERLGRARREREGIAFDAENWAALAKLAQRLGVAPPA